jgi:hypothetical protein
VSTYTNLAAATAAVANGLVTSVAMKVGAYTLAAAAPTSGARHVTCTRTVVGGADTAGTLVVVGRDLSGQTITETLIPGAHGVLVTGARFFASIISITGVGWVTDTGDDTIVVGWDAVQAVATSGGHLVGVTVNTTAAGTITLTDARGTIAILPNSVAVGQYLYDLDYSGFLRVELGAASNVTVVHGPSLPQTYAMS